MVTYGGPLSDVFGGRAADALTGLLRITRPGQPVLASVMSLLATWRHFLPSVVAGAEVFGAHPDDPDTTAALTTATAAYTVEARRLQPAGTDTA